MKDDNFPFHNTEEYQHQKSSKPPITYGDDEGTLEKKRIKNFFRHSVKAFDKLYYQEPLPIFLVATSGLQGAFYEVSHHQEDIVAHIKGNYEKESLQKLEEKVWPEVENYEKKRVHQGVQQLEDRINTDYAVTGLEDTWEAAVAGKGLKLLVEEDFQQPAYFDPQTGFMVENPDNEDDYQKRPDAIDEIIEEVINKNGQVLFTEKDTLKEHGRIAMLLRYA